MLEGRREEGGENRVGGDYSGDLDMEHCSLLVSKLTFQGGLRGRKV